MDRNGTNTLIVKNLTKIYPVNKILAVDNVTFEVRGNQILGLLGPNGAGKTTLIKMICGLIQPTSGLVCFNSNGAPSQKDIGVVLEGNRNVYWRMTPRENFHYFGLLRGVNYQDLKKRTEYLLELLSLKEKANALVQSLSRGMQQKVALGVALVHKPKLLLLDEPALGLDVESTYSISNFIRSMANLGNAIIITSHQLEFIRKTCTHVAIMNKGRIIMLKNLNSLLNLEQHSQVYVQFDSNVDFTNLKFILNDVVREFESVTNDKGVIGLKFITDIKGLQIIIDRLRSHKILIKSIQPQSRNLEEIFIELLK